jgi:hypothetical protein
MPKHPTKIVGNSFGPQIFITIDKPIGKNTGMKMEVEKNRI